MLVLFYPQVIRKHIAGLLTLIDDKNRSKLTPERAEGCFKLALYESYSSAWMLQQKKESLVTRMAET